MADRVVPTTGGKVVPGTGGAGGPVVIPGGTVGGAVGLTPAECDTCSAMLFSALETIIQTFFCVVCYALSKGTS